MKKFGIMVLCAAVAIISVFFSYYMMTISDDKELTAETVYNMARDAGYRGSLEEFINQFKGEIGEAGEKGADGIGISSVTIDERGHLIITYTDSSTVDAGLVAIDLDYSKTTSREAISRALLSSVSIRCLTSSSSIASGAGIIYKLDKDSGSAYIITNYHVLYDVSSSKIFDDDDIKVFLYGMESDKYGIPAKYIGGSAVYDVAVIKIENSDLIKNSNSVEASIADSNKIAVLDEIVAVGNSLGAGMSATRGYVNVESEYISLNVGGITSMMRVIRIDAAVNKGNSGGGIFNMSGELCGIVNSKEFNEGVDNMAYAIPINLAVSVAENIIYYCDNTENIKGQRIVLGISLTAEDSYTVYDDVSGTLLKRDEVVIKTVSPGSLAEAAGIKSGDVVKAIVIDGIEYEVTRSYQPSETAIFVRPGSTLQYKIIRSGESITVGFDVKEEYFVNID